MAKRNSQMPGLYSQGKNVFPITPFRTYLVEDYDSTEGDESAVVDLDLQFEDNEVFDIISLHVILSTECASTIAVDDMNQAIMLSENPDESSTFQLFPTTAAGVVDFTGAAGTDFPNFETNSAIIWYQIRRMQGVALVTSGGPFVYEMTKEYMYKFDQPYTVARNLKWIMRTIETVDDAAISAAAYCTVWGRRRNAPDAEFKNIIYRQRF